METRLGRKIRMLLEVSRETAGHILVGKVILGFLTIFKKCQALSTFEALNSVSFSRFQRDVRPLVQMRLIIWLSLRTQQWTQTSFHLLICKMCLHLSLCSEIHPSFESWHLRVHFTRGKHRVPLTYLFLRGKILLRCLWKVGLLFIRRQGINSHLQTIWGAWSLSPVALLKLMFL